MSAIAALKTWEGRIVDAKFPLQQWLGGSDHSAVFLTERNGVQPQKAAIKLVSAQGLTPQQQDVQLSLWSRAAQLSHAHLLRVFECGRCRMDGAPFLYVVMEFADDDLSRILPQRALAPEEVKEMLPPVVDALAYLHQAGFVHSRVKPSNVMAAGEHLKLSADTLNKIGEPGKKGIQAYDAPESHRILTPASDVWSLGILLVTVLTQREPKTQLSANGTVVIPNTITEPFLGIARRCLRVDPRQRPAAVDILKEAAAPIAVLPATVLQAAKKSAEIAERLPVRKTKAIPWLGATIVAILLLVAVLAGRWLMGHKEEGAQKVESSSTQSQPATTTSSTTSPPAAITETPKPAPSTSTRGSVLHQELPEVSQSARNTIQGHVRINIQVSVDASGIVSEARPVPPVPSQYFAKQARAAALRWKFSPPQVDGHPAPSTWVLHFQFGRTATQVSQTQR